ncbi:MAG: flagellar biosynthesis anti-sigma factor FlgM [Dehalococcoidia bacterium]|nr:MAG: flagellar biosynthesis anti-sigma factor FlgM [Dehalococcoidia bacterium]
MVLPVRPQDASGVYQRQVAQAQAAAAQETPRRVAQGGASGRRMDQVSLSAGAQSFARVMEAVQQQPDVRAERVASVRARIAGGMYGIDAGLIARRLSERAFGDVAR